MLLGALLAALLLPAASVTTASSPAQAAPQWIPGPLRADRVLDCVSASAGSYRYGDGVSMQVSYEDDPGSIMKVGDVFYARVQMRLITLPCVKVGVLPEFIPPPGLDYAVDAKHPITWSKSGSETRPRAEGRLSDMYADEGTLHGGLILGTGLPQHQYDSRGIWKLERADGVLEIRVPFKATRPMKGNLSVVPDCYETKSAEPGQKFWLVCPPSKAGDHLQVNVGLLDGGDRSSNTSHVGIFAEATGTTPKPPTPDPKPTPVVKTATSTSFGLAKTKVTTAQKAKVTVTVKPTAKNPTGMLVVKDGKKKIASAKLTSAKKGKLVVTLPKLAKGKHRITVTYGGSASLKGSTSATKTLTVVKR